MRYIITIIFTAIFSLSAQAQDATDIEATHDRILYCLKSAEGFTNQLSNAPHLCIGEYTEECMSVSPNGHTTLGMSTCTNTELQAWDQILNETYAELRENKEPAHFEMIKQAQRNWIKFRDADCESMLQPFEGGSITQIIRPNCHMYHTAQRVIDLRTRRYP